MGPATPHRRPGVALLAIALLGALPAEPERAFAAARDAWSASFYPRYARYDVLVRYRLGDRSVASTWRTFEDLRRRVVHARAFSAEEDARPAVPHGINALFTITIAKGGSEAIKVPLNRPKAEDPIGMVSFAINEDFGIAPAAPPITATRSASDAVGSPHVLALIGRTGKEARVYDVTDAGEDRGTAHLRLRPLRDPHRYRLRELWLDQKTALPVRAVVAGIGNRSPLDAVPWRVDFALRDGAPYIASETALAPIPAGRVPATDASITFTHFETTETSSIYDAIGVSPTTGTADP